MIEKWIESVIEKIRMLLKRLRTRHGEPKQLSKRLDEKWGEHLSGGEPAQQIQNSEQLRNRKQLQESEQLQDSEQLQQRIRLQNREQQNGGQLQGREQLWDKEQLQNGGQLQRKEQPQQTQQITEKERIQKREQTPPVQQTTWQQEMPKTESLPQDNSYVQTLPQEEWSLTPMFSEDAQKNRQVLYQIAESFESLCREFDETTAEDGNKQAYRKCINQFLDRLNKLIDKEIYADSDKLAGNLKKILAATLCKVWEYQGCGRMLEAYMRKWGICSRTFRAGSYLTDDDWEYLDAISVSYGKEETTDRSKNFEVIKMEQPVLYIGYLSDGELEYEFIPGKCRYYEYIN